MELTVYLSGEIHSDWREQIKNGIKEKGISITVLTPNTNHEESDSVGSKILGAEDNSFWGDHKSAKINSIRNKTNILKSDIVVVKFGDQYKQWNAAFEAGYAVASGKTIISLHSPELTHALKEIDAAATAVTQSPGEVVKILEYLTKK